MKHFSKFTMWLLVFAAAALAGCAQSYHEKEERYVLIAANINLPYWQEAAAGLRDVAKEMGLEVKVEIDGPASYSPKEEVDAAVNAANTQFPSWSATPPLRRRGLSCASAGSSWAASVTRRSDACSGSVVLTLRFRSAQCGRPRQLGGLRALRR